MRGQWQLVSSRCRDDQPVGWISMETPGQLGERGNDLNVEWQDRHDWRRGRTLQPVGERHRQ